jgi:hypothetical protein
MFGRKKQGSNHALDGKALLNYHKPKPTGLRTLTAITYLLSVLFLILVEIGNINNKPVICDTYFLQIGLTNIIPESVPNSVLINSIARTIGLHDFYQVGLWGFCEGYNDVGITYCSPPKTFYWFDPVSIILNELLAGATISLPTEIIHILHIVRTVSQWMFTAFLAGIIATFLCVFFAPMGFSKKPRWQRKPKRDFLRQLPITILTFIALLGTAAGALIATIMFVIFRNTFSSAAELNIEAKLGTPMLAFMWIAFGFNLIGFFVRIGTCCGVCCCTGKSKAFRKVEHEHSYDGATIADSEASRSPAFSGAYGVNDVNIDEAEKRRKFGFGRR